MEASADENARIQNKSISEKNIMDGYNTLGNGKKSEGSFKNTGSHHSKISNNTFQRTYI